ncbi:MAG: class A beta-lactamase-related serine hydrolase [Candidatus Omnitrophica bacterium]|nr:class A beta-lactamase-related serine hydrolase [Candidatus Omnitrophota bacterium]
MTLSLKRGLIIKTSLIIILLASISAVSLHFFREYKIERGRWLQLEKSIFEKSENFRGQACIVIKDYNRGWQIKRNPEIKIAAASIVKIPIMAAILSCQQEKGFSLCDKVKLKRSDITGGSGILKNQRPGKEFSVKELIEMMVSISDNTATNILIKLLGFDFLNSWMKEAGLKNTNISRLMMDMALRDKGIENYTTAGDIALMLDKIYLNRLSDKDASLECLRILKTQKTRNRIPAKLPKGTVVAHKTGLENGVCHDAGIVFTEKGNFLICVLTGHKNRDSYKSRKFIAALAEMVYKYYMP